MAEPGTGRQPGSIAGPAVGHSASQKPRQPGSQAARQTGCRAARLIDSQAARQTGRRADGQPSSRAKEANGRDWRTGSRLGSWTGSKSGSQGNHGSFVLCPAVLPRKLGQTSGVLVPP